MPITPGGRARPVLGDWPTRAACAGQPDVLEGDEQAAKALCDSCPVLTDCGRWVMPLRSWEDPGGVKAGLTEAQRKHFRDRARGLKANRTREKRAALERERVRDLDALAAEAPQGPVTPEDAEQHRKQLVNALTGQENT